MVDCSVRGTVAKALASGGIIKCVPENIRDTLAIRLPIVSAVLS